MEQRYKINNRITEFSKWDLPPISKVQIQWGYDHCLGKYAHLSRGKMYCLECGHSWNPENKRKVQTCPECSTKLEIIKEYRTHCKDTAYMAIVTVCKGFQVVRMVWVNKTMKMNCNAEYFGKEVMQHWITESCDRTTMSLAVNGMSSACDAWVFSSEMKVKEAKGYYNNTSSYRHNIAPYKSYPKADILPVFKRNGFKGDFHGVSPLEMFTQIIKNHDFETLLKAKQYSFLRLKSVDELGYRLWPSIKICIRNNYIVNDARMYIDYMELLQYFHKDVRNAFYVCPKNLHQSHDLLMNKKSKIQKELRAVQEKENQIKALEQCKVEQENYTLQKSKFFGILLTDGKLRVNPLETVLEFLKEGDTLHHCVFTNKYYNKLDSLILSARIDNKSIETVEINLKTMEISQSRGIHNSSSEYHDKIINLVQKNIHKIREVTILM